MTGTTGTAGYLYDARGRRVAKVTDGVTVTHYVYDTQYRVLEERDGDGDLLARYTLRLRSGQAYGTGMDEPLTMERGGNTYYYHHDGLGSITEVTDASGVLVERYEYDVYGAVTIFDGSGITLTTSAISNPYLFTARRYDPESGNYYYRARYYSPSLGRFLSQDPLGFEAGDYNLYRYAFNNPTNLTDPTGEFAFVTLLTQATAEAAADALMQAAFNWLFSPCVNTAEEALASIDCRRVGWAFLTGLVPGGRWVKSAVAAWGDVYFFLLDAEKLCMEVTPETVLRHFAWSFFSEIAGDYLGELVAKYGTRAIAKGLKKLGFDEWAERLLRQVDEVADDAGDVIDPNKLDHIFGQARHNLNPVVNAYGNREAAYNAVYSEFSRVAGNYTNAQLNRGIQVSVRGFNITVRGTIVDGVARIGTFFIP